jgi:hypothetical protein
MESLGNSLQALLTANIKSATFTEVITITAESSRF